MEEATPPNSGTASYYDGACDLRTSLPSFVYEESTSHGSDDDGAVPMPEASLARSWDEAYRVAAKTLSKMDLIEKRTLMEGTGYHGKRWWELRKWSYGGNAIGVSRLGIPSLKMQDSGSGFHTVWAEQLGTVTCWPSQLALSSTFDPASVRKFAEAVGKEFSAKGANVMLGPSVEVQRVARAGRNFERLSGEDPYLGSKLAEAYVAGVQSQGVLAVMKHWIFNDQEAKREYVSAIVDDRTAWELYYPPFQAAIEAGIAATMCSYNRIGESAVHSCSSEKHLDILRTRLGFKGWVVSDWWAMDNESHPAREVDQEMPGTGDAALFGGPYFALSKSLPTEAVDIAAKRILAAIYHVGLDDDAARRRQIPATSWMAEKCNPLDEGCKGPMQRNVTSPEHRALARQLATESVILLQNREGVLPLHHGKVSAIAVIGSAAVARPRNITGAKDDWFHGDYYSGGGSGHVTADGVVTALQGIRERALASGIAVHESPTSSHFDALQALGKSDLAVVVAATTSGESVDRADLHLDDGADELIQAVASTCSLSGKRIVVLLQIPGAVVMPWRESVDGILAMFLGGQETGAAWGAVLFGDHAPTGRLPVTMPATHADTISPSDLPKVHYSEGVATSYRSPTLNAAFPFGHGLTYTRFSYEPPQIESCGTATNRPALCIVVLIRNEGQAAGRTVAQLYVEFTSAPPPSTGAIPRPVLKGFQKTKLLRPGDVDKVEFQLFRRDLSYYDTDNGGTWRQVDNVTVHVGESSADYRHSAELERGADGSWQPKGVGGLVHITTPIGADAYAIGFCVFLVIAPLWAALLILWKFEGRDHVNQEGYASPQRSQRSSRGDGKRDVLRARSGSGEGPRDFCFNPKTSTQLL